MVHQRLNLQEPAFEKCSAVFELESVIDENRGKKRMQYMACSALGVGATVVALRSSNSKELVQSYPAW